MSLFLNLSSVHFFKVWRSPNNTFGGSLGHVLCDPTRTPSSEYQCLSIHISPQKLVPLLEFDAETKSIDHSSSRVLFYISKLLGLCAQKLKRCSFPSRTHIMNTHTIEDWNTRGAGERYTQWFYPSSRAFQTYPCYESCCKRVQEERNRWHSVSLLRAFQTSGCCKGCLRRK